MHTQSDPPDPMEIDTCETHGTEYPAGGTCSRCVSDKAEHGSIAAVIPGEWERRVLLAIPGGVEWLRGPKEKGD